jgi:hypothetical protein
MPNPELLSKIYKMKKRHRNKYQTKGSITPALLIITSAFVIIIYGLLFMLTIQLDFSHRQIASESALNIAEAGVNYYMWRLAHNPDDLTSGTGIPQDYTDTQGNVIGQFTLNVTPPSLSTPNLTLLSTGFMSDYPNIDRKISVQVGATSLAEFAFLSNGSVWHGAGVTVNGRVHSNNGVRMDGTNTSLVTSAQLSYQCGTETGCFPPENKPGVWGDGGDQSLWQFPVAPIDFNSITFDLGNLQTEAINNGLYLGPLNGNKKKRGYHIIFNNDGTYTLNEVRNTSSVEGYSVPGQGLGEQGIGGCRELDQFITNETPIGIYNVSDTPVVFVEDNLWIEGTVRGKITVAVATFPTSSSDVNVWIADDLRYTEYNGSDILGLIAQGDLYMSRDVPDDFHLDGVLIAQQGKVIRHGYFDWCGGTEGAIKQKLTVNGSIITYYKSYWNHGTGPESGFIEQEINYNPIAIFDPPPAFPSSGEFQILTWEEVK